MTNRHRLSLLLLFSFVLAPPSLVLSVTDDLLPRSLQIPSSLDDFVSGVWGQFKSLLNADVGDTRDAIVPLKRYFAQFGYLNITAGQNVTDLFDTETLDAVKLYQESFNLTVSGKLDLHTLLKIMTPRCGREDVADGIPLMLQSMSAVNSTATSHIVGHYAFFPSTPRWPSTKRNLSYAFSSMNETQRLSSDQRRRAFANAFSEWAAIVPINFTETDDYDTADIKIEFVSFSHGDGEPFDGVLGILAHAFSPTDGRFHLDDSEYWYSHSDGGSSVPQEIDLQSVVTHEIGHLIGLAHSPVENAIMYPSIAPGQVKLQLQQDDIQGAQALYGANPDYNPNNPLPGIPPSVENVNKAHKMPCFSSLCFTFCSMLLLAMLERMW